MNRKERRKQIRDKKGNITLPPAPSLRPTNADLDMQVKQAFERHKANDLAYADGVYRKVLSHNPNQPLALHYLGLIAQQTGHAADAIKLISRSISLDKSDAKAHNHLGQIYAHQKDYGKAGKYIKTALDMEPENVDFLNNYGNCLKHFDDIDGAVALYRKVLEISPQTTNSTYNLANALKIQKDYDQAIIWFRKTLVIDPDHFQAHHNLGVSLEQKGNFEGAVLEYLEVLRINPKHIKSMSNLIAIKSYKPDQKMVGQAETMFKAPDLRAEDQMKLGYGLGKHYDRTEDYKQAFDYFKATKNIKRAQNKPFNIEAVRQRIEKMMGVFTKDYFAQMAPHGHPSDRPVFIVGMPRSGTTLTEQILASHPEIFGAGELQEIPKIVKEFYPDYPAGLEQTDKSCTQQMAERFLSHIGELSPESARRVTDKLPVNFMHLGLIATLFPNARIVHCLRDPMDVGLSCFIELFSMDQDYSTSLEDFGQYYLLYDRLMNHWRDVLPLAFHEQYYEELITDQEKHIRALIAHSGLDWHEGCLNFQETDRAVMTPSRWQVRQPIYKSSSGRWKNYEEHMEPLRRVLDKNNFHYGRH